VGPQGVSPGGFPRGGPGSFPRCVQKGGSPWVPRGFQGWVQTGGFPEGVPQLVPQGCTAAGVIPRDPQWVSAEDVSQWDLQ
jgi:hypothetical protein